ncbi:DUF2480 family protein [Flavobacterium jejuense]|uniref:DUF2480 family protein n=1 Tax=Flavobacterium jejuense TaxID=1544455 RepID=A0ABX0IQM7_9FLAO|nr:DUF2480 family protein [Flavobacterium jejuense]NHN25501.1 DUF2480 family protein [Flavobacterium jejuense]
MEKEIINKVANSKLEVFDLEDYFPREEIIVLDISQWLFEGFILKEKDFREALNNYNWSQYAGKGITLFCSSDAILPAWTFALVTTYLQPFAKNIVHGSIEDYLLISYKTTLDGLDYNIYMDKPLILKGCAKKPVPQEIYTLAIQKIMPFAKSIMFGEACSAVPLFKSK